ncbi:MAG TPA: zinc-dependent alcohol dehydrogenase [Arenibaculum sp.]|nr:zinc-dependent alcohol dehydrogenase [Arenibaculum sp.]
MRALVWHGKQDVRVEQVPDPGLVNPSDAIVRITSTAICGSDLHLYGGSIPALKPGDGLGHEFMREVVETGSEVKTLKVGDRVVVPVTIACGHCFFCEHELTSLCDNSNPNAGMAAELMGHSPSGLFGYTHLFGGYAGGQAEYVRVPFADVGPYKVPDGLDDDKVLFLTDIFPTGYMAAENADIKPGDVVAIWGAGPVGQFAIRSARMLGAEKVIAIDTVPERLSMAEAGGAQTIDFLEDEVYDRLMDMTGGRGPDSCIDAVGMEAHGSGSFDAVLDRVKHAAFLATDRAHVLRQAIIACRKGGTVSVPGVYGGFLDKVPFGAVMNKALTIKSGQTHVHRYLDRLMKRIQAGDIDPSFVITHHLPLSEAPHGYAIFQKKQDGCIKVVLKP